MVPYLYTIVIVLRRHSAAASDQPAGGSITVWLALARLAAQTRKEAIPSVEGIRLGCSHARSPMKNLSVSLDVAFDSSAKRRYPSILDLDPDR